MYAVFHSKRSSVIANISRIAIKSRLNKSRKYLSAPRPTASNLNVVAGRITPNAVFTRIGANGTVCVFAQTTVDVVVDISGSFLA